MAWVVLVKWLAAELALLLGSPSLAVLVLVLPAALAALLACGLDSLSLGVLAAELALVWDSLSVSVLAG